MKRGIPFSPQMSAEQAPSEAEPRPPAEQSVTLPGFFKVIMRKADKQGAVNRKKAASVQVLYKSSEPGSFRSRTCDTRDRN